MDPLDDLTQDPDSPLATPGDALAPRGAAPQGSRAPHGGAPPRGEEALPRRGFLSCAATGAAGAAAILGPLGVAGYAFVDPIRKKGEASSGFLPVATTDSVPADGKPRLFRVLGEHRDAWTYHGRSPLGAVYLRRLPEKPGEVLALNTTCPHLGCFVSTTSEGTFHCPCHDSAFAADGSLADPNSPSPRGLDPLEAKIEGETILVRFLDFETGRTSRVPVL